MAILMTENNQLRRLNRALRRVPNFYKWLVTGSPRVEAVVPTPYSTGGTWPPLLQMAGHGGTVSRRTTRNWPNCTNHDESAHQNNCICRAKKVEGRDQKNFRRGLRWRFPSYFQICSGANLLSS